jgi:hypothetical protein
MAESVTSQKRVLDSGLCRLSLKASLILPSRFWPTSSSEIGVFLSGPRAANVMIIRKYLKRERRSLLDELPEGTQIKIGDRWPIRIYEVDIESDDDIRIRRTVRAPDFQQNAFEKIVGQRRYRWMKTLGNRSIITKRGRMEIADPNAANDLLEHVLQAHDQKRRVLFFCACEYPGTVHSPNCHRAAVAGLLLKAAHHKGARLTVAEWPSGEPRTVELRTSPHIVKKVLRGATRVPLPKKDRREFAALPWCSRLKLSSDESSVAIVSGPAKIGRDWFLPILGPKISKQTDTLASLQKTAAHLRRSGRYTPRS